VIRQLLPLVTALTIATVMYVVREQRRRRLRIHPARPDITMREVCAEPALVEIERRCLATDDPRVAFRQAAIESLVGALYLETIAECGVANTEQMLAAYTQVWHALREYLRLRYDDAAQDDWFEHFMAIARPYIREKVRLTHEYALHLDEGAERFARIYDELLRDLVKDALRAPQKKAFVPPDFSHS
jgi:hypothetical protein